jgi:hypothetical protein
MKYYVPETWLRESSNKHDYGDKHRLISVCQRRLLQIIYFLNRNKWLYLNIEYPYFW